MESMSSYNVSKDAIRKVLYVNQLETTVLLHNIFEDNGVTSG
jgi:hypothetical protein